MKNAKNGRLQIWIALLFAALILLTSYLMKGSEHATLAVNLLIALYFVSFTYLNKRQNKCCK